MMTKKSKRTRRRKNNMVTIDYHQNIIKKKKKKRMVVIIIMMIIVKINDNVVVQTKYDVMENVLPKHHAIHVYQRKNATKNNHYRYHKQ